MNKWIAWIPNVSIPPIIYSLSSRIDEKGVVLEFEDEARTMKIYISFLQGFLSFRETDEGILMKTFADLTFSYKAGRCAGGILYTVENSNYLQWFKEESLGIYDEKKIEHYVIISYDGPTEVLATAGPIIKVVHESEF